MAQCPAIVLMPRFQFAHPPRGAGWNRSHSLHRASSSGADGSRGRRRGRIRSINVQPRHRQRRPLEARSVAPGQVIRSQESKHPATAVGITPKKRIQAGGDGGQVDDPGIGEVFGSLDDQSFWVLERRLDGPIFASVEVGQREA